MGNPAVTRGGKKALRTLVQMIVSGGLTALVNALASGLEPTAQLAVAAGWMFIVTYAQNSLETSGTIPTLLPTAGLVTTAAGGVVGATVGTVDAVAHAAGDAVAVVGDVVDTGGTVVGAVSGAAGGLIGGLLGGKK